MAFLPIVFFIAVYVYVALALSTIAKKTNTAGEWMAWVPIANILLMLAIAKKPAWWIILLLIPLVNLIIVIITWMAIAEARKKPGWWGVVIAFVPIVNFILIGLLAWTD